jgi:MoaA/NifB/PqqE/SkfB family radical SAM enzyme
MLPRPEPSAGVAAYDMERAICLATDHRKADNFRRFQRRDWPYLPTKLDIEGVSRCNFACTMCAVSKWKKGTRARDMTLEEFKSLIDEQYGLVEIKLNGIGEPLMAGDTFFEMIKYARSKRIWVRITTNASLLHLRGNAQKLVDSGVNEIDISIDGADAPTFEGIRIQGDFNRVRENCKLLNSLTDKTKMWTLVQKGNVHKLGDHVRLAKELGFKNLVFSLQLHGWGDDGLEERNKGEEVKLTEGYLWTLVKMGKANGVRVAFWDVSSKFTQESPCPWPFGRAVVTSDLRTVPCCMIGDPDKFELGKGMSFLKAWNSDEYQDFRAAHLSGQIPSVCKGCYK